MERAQLEEWEASLRTLERALEAREEALENREKTVLVTYAFWDHDNNPCQMLGGTVSEFLSNGSVQLKEYGPGFAFNPAFYLHGSAGARLRELIEIHRDGYQHTLSRLHQVERRRFLERAISECPGLPAQFKKEHKELTRLLFTPKQEEPCPE